jgi:membrane-associated phospholipid phosphatase
VIHWRFPTAPPRLAGVGLEDTLRTLSGIDIGSPQSAALSNPVAAVPSLHAAYALGVGIGLLVYGRRALTRAVGLLYPPTVVLTIVVTGNHFFVDAIAGVAVLAAGFGFAWRRRSGRRSSDERSSQPCLT